MYCPKCSNLTFRHVDRQVLFSSLLPFTGRLTDSFIAKMRMPTATIRTQFAGATERYQRALFGEHLIFHTILSHPCCSPPRFCGAFFDLVKQRCLPRANVDRAIWNIERVYATQRCLFLIALSLTRSSMSRTIGR